jgi:hypothetical protein
MTRMALCSTGTMRSCKCPRHHLPAASLAIGSENLNTLGFCTERFLQLSSNYCSCQHDEDVLVAVLLLELHVSLIIHKMCRRLLEEELIANVSLLQSRPAPVNLPVRCSKGTHGFL